MLLAPQQISAALATSRRRQTCHHQCAPAAILMPLFNRDGQTQVLVIEKAQDESKHAGQMAFPGGKIESADRSPAGAALREAKEEIHLQPEQVQVLGFMGYFRTMTSRFDAAVTVGWLSETFSLHPNREVKSIFCIPLEALLLDFDPSLKTWTRTGLLNLHFHVQPLDVTRTICIWGLTARILHHFFMALKMIPEAG